MTHQSSYRVDSFASSTSAEIRRLNAQVDLFWPAEGELLMRHGLRDGMRTLDCGCGPGRLLELLKDRLPALSCIGLEVDPLLVDVGQKRIVDCGLSDCSIQQGTAENPGLSPKSFDFIILRLVLEHLSDPLAALKSLSELLKPGGRLAVISNDFDFHLRTSPPVPELDRLYEAYCASRRNDGGDPCIGRRVPRLLVDSGLMLTACEIELAHSVVLGDSPFLKAEGAGIPTQLVKTGFLDEKTLDAMTRSWRSMLDAPDHCIARPLWVAIAERSELKHPVHEIGAPGAAKRRVDFSDKQSTEKQSGRVTLEQMLTLVAIAVELEAVAPDDSLADLVIDSLAAINLQEQIKARTGVEIPVFRLMEDKPVHSLMAAIGDDSVTGTRSQTEKAENAVDDSKWEEGEL